MEKIIRVGIIGMGGISQLHVEALRLLEGVRIAAVCDISEPKRLAAAEKTGARAFADWHALLADPEIDAVHINSPGDDFWMMVNMTSEAIDFRVQAAEEGNVWRRLIDTASWAEPASNHWPEGDGMIVRDVATVQPWSIVVWHQLERPDGSRPVPVWQD